MYLLAIDPGKNVGWALFHGGRELERGVIDIEKLHEYLHPDESGWLEWDSQAVNQLVVEDYVNDPGTPQGGRRNPASEVKGAIEFIGRLCRVPVEVQTAGQMHHAMKFVGYVEPKTRTGKKKHVPDEDSAYLHGVYYLVKNGLMKPLPLD